MRRMIATVAVLVCTLALSAGCGDDEKSPDTNDRPAETKTIDVTVTGDSVTPNGDRVPVSVGQQIELVVTADEPGEIHVHSDPEQEFEYEAGTTTFKLNPIEKPSIVEVESHTLEKIIVQLEAR